MDLSKEHPNAEFFLWIASADSGGHKLFDPRPKCAFALLCLKSDGSQFGLETSNGSAAANDYNPRALIIGMGVAVKRLPANAIVHVVSDQNWFIDLLNADRAARMASDYFRPNGKSKYSYESEWRALDELCESKNIRVTAGRAVTASSKANLDAIKESASQCARNVHRPHSDWDL